MNRLVLMLMFLMLTLNTAFALNSQYPDPQRQTMWNNITDSVNTMGQDPVEKTQTLKKLHSLRYSVRQHSIWVAKRQAYKAKMQAWTQSQPSQ